jgi:glyoxylase-like metal-dependent hydrolase (beta-lactamase superfamily II)
MSANTEVTELHEGIFQIRGLGGSSHSYVLKGDYLNVMIDSGSDQNFPVLERGLRHIGMKVRDVNLVINSHEHCDHIGANRYFQECAMIAAYRLAASKMTTGDYYVTLYKGNDLNEMPMRVHLWLENMTRIDLGNYTLRVFHTPADQRRHVWRKLRRVARHRSSDIILTENIRWNLRHKIAPSPRKSKGAEVCV